MRRNRRQSDFSATSARWRRSRGRLVALGRARGGQRLEFVVAQRDLGGGNVLLQVGHTGGAGNRQHHRGSLQQPRQRQLRGRRVVTGRNLLQWAVGGGQRSGGQREPRDEGDALAGRGIQQRFGGASGQVVHVLHRHDRRDLLGGGELIDVDLGEPDMTDLAFVLQRDEFTDLRSE